jgi:hypothetical protein
VRCTPSTSDEIGCLDSGRASRRCVASSGVRESPNARLRPPLEHVLARVEIDIPFRRIQLCCVRNPDVWRANADLRRGLLWGLRALDRERVDVLHDGLERAVHQPVLRQHSLTRELLAHDRDFEARSATDEVRLRRVERTERRSVRCACEDLLVADGELERRAWHARGHGLTLR